MKPVFRALLAFVVSLFQSRVSLPLESLAPQYQLAVYHRSIRRPRVRPSDRIFWSWLAMHWSRWREVLVFVQPATVSGERSASGTRRPRRRREPAGEAS